MNRNDQWHLGEELDAPLEDQEPQPPPSRAPTVSNLSRDRLTRPVYVVTAEHLGWTLVAAYAFITRLSALGARPLDPAEAPRPLAALPLSNPGLARVHRSSLT